MRLLDIEITNFGPYAENQRIDFSIYNENDNVLIVGDNKDTPGADSNGAGKSSFLNAMSWALYGDVPNKISTDDVIRRGDDVDYCQVKFHLKGDNDEDILIDRKRTKAGKHKLAFFVDGEDESRRTTTQTQKALLNHLGILENNKEYFNDFLNTTYFSIDMVKSFAGKEAGSKDRMDLIGRFLRLELIDKAASRAKVRSNQLESDLQIKEGQIEFLSNKLNEDFDLQKIDSEITELETSVKALRIDNKDLEKEIKTLESIKGIQEQIEDKKATITRAQENNKSLIESYQSQIKDLKARFEKRQSLKKEIEKQEDDLKVLKAKLSKKSLDEFESHYRNGQVTLTQVSSKIQNYTNQIEHSLICPSCDEHLMLSGDELSTFDLDKLKKEKEELVERKSKIKAKLDEFKKKYDAEKQLHTQIDSLSSTIQNNYKRYTDLESVPEKIEELENKIEDKQESHKEYIESIKGQITKLEFKISKYGDFDLNLIEDYKTTLETNQENIEKFNKEITRLESQIESHKEDQKQLKKLKGESKEIRAELSKYQFWVKGFPQIKRWVIENFLPSFEHQANHYLSKMEVGMRVQFNTMKEKKSSKGEYKDQFDITIIDENQNKRDLETYSQGESKRIGVCVGFSLRELTLNKGYSSFNFLMMDEIIDSLDETGIGEFFNLLQIISGLKLLISHNSDLKSRFKHTIKAVKENGKTYIIQE